MKIKITAILAAMLAAVALSPAHAQVGSGLTFSFTSPDQTALAGTSIDYSGTLTNNSGQALDIGLDFFPTLPDVANTTPDDSSFFNTYTIPYVLGTPVVIQNGSSLSVDAFNLAISPTAPNNETTSGVWEIDTYTDTSGDGLTYVDTPFSVTINNPAAVPEASSLVGMGLLLGAFAFVAVRSRRMSLTPSA